jgi:hypothetical protein
MLALALALALAQPLQLEPVDPFGPIFSQPSTLNRYAFFEAFPTSGAGAGTACPLPNWLTSTAFTDAARWVPQGTVTAPTISSTAEVAPDGSAASRAQVAATTGTDISRIYGTQGSGIASGAVFSVYVKGYGGTSGVIDIAGNFGGPTSGCGCTYNGTSWTLCTSTLTASGANPSIGNAGSGTLCGSGSRSALDVYIAGPMWNVGAARAPYVATTTVAATSLPTGARGEALTFTRSGTATCTKTATGGLATTLIQDGDLVVMPANMPRVEYDSAGTLGLLVESARTNSCLQSQSLNVAPWASATTAGAVTVTADQAVAPDGTLTAERLQVSACPTAATISARNQPVVLAAPHTWSIYVKGNGTSGNIGLISGNGGTYTGATCAYVSASWTRCSVTSAAFNTGEVYIGCINNAVASPNPGNTGAADVFVWGGQLEAGAYATSYLATSTVAVARGAEKANFTLSSGICSTGSCSIAVTETVVATGAVTWAPFSLHAAAGNYFQPYNSGGAFRAEAFFGSPLNSIGAVQGSLTGARIGQWQDGTNLTAFVNATNYPVAGTRAVTATTLYVGSDSAVAVIDGIVSRVCADPSPTRCR